MRKRNASICGAFAVLCILLCATPSARAATVAFSPGELTVDDQTCTLEMYSIDGYNYVKLRDFAAICACFSVSYDAINRMVIITTGDCYTSAGVELQIGTDQSVSAIQSSQPLSVDGIVVSDIPCWNIGDTNYFQLAALSRYLGFTLVNDTTVYTYDRDNISSLPIRLDLACGSISVFKKPECVLYRQGATRYYGTGGCIIQQSSSGAATANTITVASGEIALTISGLNIESETSPIAVSSGAKLTLNLIDTNTMRISGYGAGIQVPTGAELVLRGTGTVTVNGGSYGAGIGGGGNITINSGTVTASSAQYGAGIGGSDGGDGGTITITDGTVMATGGIYGGAGIGGGDGGSGGTITITGGTVTATGRRNSAGIGGSCGGSAGAITISGGVVTATGGYGNDGSSGCAGIGSGNWGSGGTISVENAKVYANGEYNAIGGGQIANDSGCDSITIINAEITCSRHYSGGYDYQERINFSTVPDAAALEGNGAAFSLIASGHSGLSYQWQSSADNLAWTDVVGQTSAAASIPMSGSNDGYYYRCQITNGWSNVVYTEPARAYVLAFTQQPRSVDAGLNDVTSLSAISACTNVTYQWQRSYDDGATWTNIIGEVYSTLIVNATLSENNAPYRCVITAANGDMLPSDAVRITVASNATTYTTRFYLERPDGSGYDLAELIATEAAAGASVTAAVKTFDHFTENTMKGTHSGTVEADNSLVLSRYYDRDSYTVTYDTNDGTAIGSTSVKYGAALSLPAPSKMGCTFGGWYCDAALKQTFTDTTMPGESLMLYAKWDVIGEGRGIEYKINGITLRDGSYQSVSTIPHGTFYAEVSVTNISSETIDTLLLTTYDINGRMLGLSFLYANPQTGQTFVLGMSLDNSKGEIAKIKAFMLPILGGMVPLAEAVELAM